jgi:hypothetical protein
MQEFNMYDSDPVIGAGSRDTFLYGLAGLRKRSTYGVVIYSGALFFFLLMIHPREREERMKK